MNTPMRPLQIRANAPQRAVESTTAPASSNNSSDRQPEPYKPYACQSCVRRKVRCDRVSPICSSCTKSKFECHYQAPPPPRARKRRLGAVDGDGVKQLRERVQRYERTLQENGLLRAADAEASASPLMSEGHDHAGKRCVATEPMTPASEGSVQTPPVVQPNNETARVLPERSLAGTTSQPPIESIKSGRFFAGHGKSRYISSQVWLDAGDADMAEMSSEDQDHQNQLEQNKTPSFSGSSISQDPLSGALLGVSHDLLGYHPVPAHALRMWEIHAANVQPLCKILHIPSTQRMIETVTHQPATATKGQECLMFAIYHSAMISLDDAECVLEFGQSLSALLERYEFAIRQALVNASWLRTTDISVLQACILHLIAMRGRMDANTYWILTGAAVRIAQRMGLHRDGESLGLSPYDVEMRRRAFWQLVPLDSYAGQISGTGIAITPDSWDTKQPLNINDDQIYPGMTTIPEEQKRASDMLFCRTKAELSNLYTRTGVKAQQGGPAIDLRDGVDLEKVVGETEEIIESKYLRYCDILDPLHVFTLGFVRSAANMVRLRARIKPLMNQAIGDGQRRELCVLARKILDTNNALYRDPRIKGFRWQIKNQFLWDSLICVLMSLAKPNFFSVVELNAAWNMLEEVFSNHPEIIEGKGAIRASIGRATLAAWRANPRKGQASLGEEDDPTFILRLRQLQESKDSRNRVYSPAPGHDESAGVAATTTVGSVMPSDADNGAHVMTSFEELFGDPIGQELDLDGDFVMQPDDWIFWNQFSQSDGSTDLA